MADVIIPLNINATCNLACPFCYLEGMPGKSVSREHIDTLLSLGYATYVCIGKEPTVSPGMLAYFLRRAQEFGYPTGFITNGLLLDQFLVKYPDVHAKSIDITYHKGDDLRWDEEQVVKGAVRAREHCTYLSVLFVLHAGTLELLEKALAFTDRIGAQQCLVSPMIPTVRAHAYDIALTFPALEQFFAMLQGSPAFMRSTALTAVDDYHFLEAGLVPMQPCDVMELANRYDLGDKVTALGDPFLRERPVMDVDLMGDVPEAIHPVARLNTAPHIRQRFPSVPLRGESATELYEALKTKMSSFDFFKALS